MGTWLDVGLILRDVSERALTTSSRSGTISVRRLERSLRSCSGKGLGEIVALLLRQVVDLKLTPSIKLLSVNTRGHPAADVSASGNSRKIVDPAKPFLLRKRLENAKRE